MDNKDQVNEVKPVGQTEEIKQVEEKKEEKPKDKQVTKTDYKNPEAFNNKEKVLYEQEEEPDSNPTGVLIIFGVLILGILFLPLVDRVVYKNTGKNAYQNIFDDAQGVVNQPNLDNRFFFDTNQISAGIGTLELKNFVTSESEFGHEITFTIINNGDDAYLFDKKYYMDFYKGEELLYHALIHSYRPIASKAAAELTLAISKKAYDNADSIKLVEIKTIKYPELTFTTREDEYELLTCTYGRTETVYYFKDKMLEKIRETYTNKDYSDEKYAGDKNDYSKLVSQYRDIDGINANFVETPTEFTAQIDFALVEVQDNILSGLKQYRYFKYHEKADIVAFEMSAQGYVCK